MKKKQSVRKEIEFELFKMEEKNRDSNSVGFVEENLTHISPKKISSKLGEKNSPEIDPDPYGLKRHRG